MALSFTGSFPAALGLFTAGFEQPPVPSVATELQGHFVQHKWNNRVSNIASGYWYNSAENVKVRVDETFDGGFGSSLFDYSDIDEDGAVKNRQILVESSVNSQPTCFDDFVENPAFPLITTDFLRYFNATFGGIVQEPFLGETQTWNLLFAGSTPAIVYLDAENVLLGYDFWSEVLRTKAVTRFFAHQVGPIASEVFADFPCSDGVEQQSQGLNATN